MAKITSAVLPSRRLGHLLLFLSLRLFLFVISLGIIGVLHRTVVDLFAPGDKLLDVTLTRQASSLLTFSMAVSTPFPIVSSNSSKRMAPGSRSMRASSCWMLSVVTIILPYHRKESAAVIATVFPITFILLFGKKAGLQSLYFTFIY